MCSCYYGLRGDNSGKVITSEGLLKFILMCCRLEQGEKKTSWCGWGRCLISSMLICIHPTHPSATRLFSSIFFILSNRFSLLKTCRSKESKKGCGGLSIRFQDKLIEKNVGTKWKAAYSHGGSVSCHRPLQCAEIMCLRGFHGGYSFLDRGARRKEPPPPSPPFPLLASLVYPCSFSPPSSRVVSKSGEAPKCKGVRK